MKNRMLLPAAILKESSPGSVERILARDFWGGIRGEEGKVIPLLRRPKVPSAKGFPSQSNLSTAARNH